MDDNKELFKQLRLALRKSGKHASKLKEEKSRNNNLIQLADYVANISAAKIKNSKDSEDAWKLIKDKCIKTKIITIDEKDAI